MTYEFEYLLHLLGSSVQGKEASAPKKPIDWRKLFQLAKEQTVYPMVLYALKQQPELYGTEHKDWVKRELRVLLVAEVLRRDASAELLNALENAGITPVVLKGYSLSHLYPEPSVRQSADLDIYVGLQNEEKAQEVLRSYGVQVKDRAEEAQEASCYYEPVGCIELHAWLMGKDDRAAWLASNPSGITQPFKIVTLDHGEHIHTLGDDDNMLFLTLHFIKHFVKYGANLRNLLDVILFYRFYSKNYNCADFWAKMRELRFENLVRALISVGPYYLSIFQEENSNAEPAEASITDRILSDIENGGWMGQKESEDRNRIRLIYERALYNRMNAKGNFAYLWMKRKRIKQMWRTIFCSKEYLCNKYHYAEKSAFYLAIAYLHRCIDGIIKLKKGQISIFIFSVEKSSQYNDITQLRYALFQDLDIL